MNFTYIFAIVGLTCMIIITAVVFVILDHYAYKQKLDSIKNQQVNNPKDDYINLKYEVVCPQCMKPNNSSGSYIGIIDVKKKCKHGFQKGSAGSYCNCKEKGDHWCDCEASGTVSTSDNKPSGRSGGDIPSLNGGCNASNVGWTGKVICPDCKGVWKTVNGRLKCKCKVKK
jgi:hypothetical protein